MGCLQQVPQDSYPSAHHNHGRPQTLTIQAAAPCLGALARNLQTAFPWLITQQPGDSKCIILEYPLLGSGL